MSKRKQPSKSGKNLNSFVENMNLVGLPPPKKIKQLNPLSNLQMQNVFLQEEDAIPVLNIQPVVGSLLEMPSYILADMNGGKEEYDTFDSFFARIQQLEQQPGNSMTVSINENLQYYWFMDVDIKKEICENVRNKIVDVIKTSLNFENIQVYEREGGYGMHLRLGFDRFDLYTLKEHWRIAREALKQEFGGQLDVTIDEPTRYNVGSSKKPESTMYHLKGYDSVYEPRIIASKDDPLSDRVEQKNRSVTCYIYKEQLDKALNQTILKPLMNYIHTELAESLSGSNILQHFIHYGNKFKLLFNYIFSKHKFDTLTNKKKCIEEVCSILNWNLSDFENIFWDGKIELMNTLYLTCCLIISQTPDMGTGFEMYCKNVALELEITLNKRILPVLRNISVHHIISLKQIGSQIVLLHDGWQKNISNQCLVTLIGAIGRNATFDVPHLLGYFSNEIKPEKQAIVTRNCNAFYKDGIYIDYVPPVVVSFECVSGFESEYFSFGWNFDSSIMSYFTEEAILNESPCDGTYFNLIHKTLRYMYILMGANFNMTMFLLDFFCKALCFKLTRKIILLYGPSACNGKTVFINILNKVADNLLMPLNSATLKQSGSSDIKSDLAAGRKSSILLCDDNGCGNDLSKNDLLKALSGNSIVYNRTGHEFGKNAKYESNASILFASQKLLKIGEDNGFKSRLIVIEFFVRFEKCKNEKNESFRNLSKRVQASVKKSRTAIVEQKKINTDEMSAGLQMLQASRLKFYNTESAIKFPNEKALSSNHLNSINEIVREPIRDKYF